MNTELYEQRFVELTFFVKYRKILYEGRQKKVTRNWMNQRGAVRACFLLHRAGDLLLGCPFQGCPVLIRFSVVCAEKRSPEGGKTRGSGTDKRCSHKWFHRVFSCMNPCTDTFCTLSALPLKNPQGVANLKKAICVVRSDSTMGVTL